MYTQLLRILFAVATIGTSTAQQMVLIDTGNLNPEVLSSGASNVTRLAAQTWPRVTPSGKPPILARPSGAGRGKAATPKDSFSHFLSSK